MTGQQMCETIAWVSDARDHWTVDPVEVWNANTSGELWPVLVQFDLACLWISEQYGSLYGTAAGLDLVDVLPVNPVHGQEVLFQNAEMAAQGKVWRLLYRADGGYFKWEYKDARAAA